MSEDRELVERFLKDNYNAKHNYADWKVTCGNASDTWEYGRQSGYRDALYDIACLLELTVEDPVEDEFE